MNIFQVFNPHPARNRRGVALIIVLAFIVLLTGLLVAFFSRSIFERQSSNASLNENRVDLLARGAINTITADLKQEIAAGSVVVTQTTPAPTIYVPASPLTMIPCLVASTGSGGLQNLIKTSAYQVPFYSGINYNISSYPPPGNSTDPVATRSRAAGPVQYSATNVPSLNGRSITPNRWNNALLMPVSSGTDYTPLITSGTSPSVSGTFPIPDWILVDRQGANPTTWNPDIVTSATNGTTVVGRYAYAIYNEGGLLDANVAGYPSVTASNQLSYKPAEAYADLTRIGMTSAQVDSLVGWRNCISANASGSLQAGYSLSGSNYFNSIMANSTGFLTVAGTAVNNAQSDQMFVSRQQLIQFFENGLGVSGTGLDILNYLTTYSRGLNQPSLIRLQSTNKSKALDYNASVPHVLAQGSGGNSAFGADDKVNPSFPGVTVLPGNTFTRNDGSTAQPGEPLVKRRFALNRLAWVTYKGPSAKRSQSDPDIQALINDGIPWSYLQQGTATNIQNYFGLTWANGTTSGSNNYWTYNVHNGTAGKGPIMRLGDIAALSTPHDPDFFEVLKATINVGALGKALAVSNTAVPADIGGSQPDQPYNYNYYAESSVDFQVLQIGANIISQFQPANYPTRIVFDDGSGTVYAPRSIVGVENLPYLYNIIDGILQLDPPIPLPNSDNTYTTGTNITSSGVAALMEMPVIWNPHDPSSPVGAVAPTKYRVVADSTTPDQAGTGSYNSLFVYGEGQVKSSGSTWNSYSYSAAPGSPGDSGTGSNGTGNPGNGWYTSPTGTGVEISNTFNANNSAIDLIVASGTLPLFSEPTMLMRPKIVTDSNGNQINVAVNVNRGETNRMTSDPAVSGFYKGGGLETSCSNSLGMVAPEKQDPVNTPYIGFYFGAFPMSWLAAGSGTSAAYASSAQGGCYLAQTGPPGTTPAGSTYSCYMTYRMQYLDTNVTPNQWITYDTKYGQVTGGPGQNTFGIGAPSLMCGNGYGGFWATATDPRSSRFGLLWKHCTNSATDSLAGSGGMGSSIPGPEYEFLNTPAEFKYAVGWLDTQNGIIYSVRPDAYSGFYIAASGSNGCWPVAPGSVAGWMAWISTFGSNVSISWQGIAPGLLSQNNSDVFYQNIRYYGSGQGNYMYTPNYFADPDGMVRRAMGAFVPTGDLTSPTFITDYLPTFVPSADTAVGLPMARAFNWNTSPNNTIVPTTPDPSRTVYTSGTQVTSQAQSRPYFLHRPFYSVAELGYVFSDTPWRNLDFSTAESGNTALLDAFCINDSDNVNVLVAGKVDLNTRQTPVIDAVLSGAYLDPVQPGAPAATGALDPITAQLVAAALTVRTSDTNNISNGTGPVENPGDLVGKWVANMAIQQLPIVAPTSCPVGISGSNNEGVLLSASNYYDGKLSYAGFSGGVWDNTSTNLGKQWRGPAVNAVQNFRSPTGQYQTTGTAEDIYSAYMDSPAFTSGTTHSGTRETVAYIERFREAPIRALANAGQTRVWNLLIDVIAQTGRYPQIAGSLDKFMVEGEQRYWVHVAIDRLTGQVLDRQIEMVK